MGFGINNHKYSTIILIGMLFIVVILFAGALDSGDLDDLCSVDGQILERAGGAWACGIDDVGDNITYNHTIVANAYTLTINSTIYDTFITYNYNMSDGTGSGNLSWNESRADLLYAGIEWDYNMTIDSAFDYNMSIPYDEFNYNMSDGNSGNSSWNESYADGLYVDIDGDTMTGQLIIQEGNGQIVTTNGAGAISVQTSGGQPGAISFGNTADIGISTDGTVDGYDYDGTLVVKQKTSNPQGDVEFLFIEEAGDWRFALPKSGAGLGTYNPRSFIIAGPSINNGSAVSCHYWGFNNLDCNTSITGADLGVQDDFEVLGSAYIGEDIYINGNSVGNFNYNMSLYDAYNYSLYVPDNSITLDIANITNFLYNYNQSIPYDTFNYNMSIPYDTYNYNMTIDSEFDYNMSIPYDNFNYNMTSAVDLSTYLQNNTQVYFTKVGLGITPVNEVTIKQGADTFNNGLRLIESGAGTDYWAFAVALNDLYIGDNGATNVVFLENGAVGIGDTTPDGKMQVVGDEVRIGTGTPGSATGDGDLYVVDDIESDNLNYAGAGDGYVCYQSSGLFTWWDADCQSASPYLHAVMPDGTIEKRGVEFLADLNKASWENTQLEVLSDFNLNKYVIKEPKPETAYIDMLQKVVYGTSSGNISGILEYHILLPNITKLEQDNGNYLIMEEGDEIMIEFDPVPIGFEVIGAVIRTNGYYISYDDSKQINYQISNKQIVYNNESNTTINHVVISANWNYEEVSGTFEETFSVEKIKNICTSKTTCKNELKTEFERIIEKMSWDLIIEKRTEAISFNYDEGDLI